MASSSLAGINVMHPAIVVKMLQNILIAPIAVVVTARWNVNIGILFAKFPKFVFGFLIVAVITTALPKNLSDAVGANLFIISEWFSGLSFLLIGYDIDLNIIGSHLFKQKKIVALYLMGQSLDILTTLGMAVLCFQMI